MTTPLLLGLMGRKRAGKDTLAMYLGADHGFARFAFADRLKAVALETDPIVTFSGTRLSRLIVDRGWEGAKEYPNVRVYLQYLGVAVRNNLGEETWIRPVIEEASRAPRAVVTDVRFPNEAEAIRKAGGYIVRVDRPGLPDDDGHVSEHAWRSVTPDFVITNSGSRMVLQARATTLVAALKHVHGTGSVPDKETDFLDRLARQYAGAV